MSLEQVLQDLEKGGGPVRDPERYFFTIFGTPSDRGKWGWRVEGHHLSLNFALEDGKVVAATPSLLRRQSRPRSARGRAQGLRTLADRRRHGACGCVQALDDDQKKMAVVSPRGPQGDPRGQHAPAAHRRRPWDRATPS